MAAPEGAPKGPRNMTLTSLKGKNPRAPHCDRPQGATPNSPKNADANKKKVPWWLKGRSERRLEKEKEEDGGFEKRSPSKGRLWDPSSPDKPKTTTSSASGVICHREPRVTSQSPKSGKPKKSGNSPPPHPHPSTRKSRPEPRLVSDQQPQQARRDAKSVISKKLPWQPTSIPPERKCKPAKQRSKGRQTSLFDTPGDLWGNMPSQVLVPRTDRQRWDDGHARYGGWRIESIEEWMKKIPKSSHPDQWIPWPDMSHEESWTAKDEDEWDGALMPIEP
ncbi:hypothetical protein B7494_g2549 [Chlorociboria aeruginascens]|nr:hypothetical protein B7494_g2549 [Chlorociboria aeruginascens]